MTTSDFRFGFRIVGGCFENRRLVDAAAALSAHAAADPRCEPDKECYLSAFRFAATFRRHLEDNQARRPDYSGPCWSPWLWWDIDAEELQYAHKDAGRAGRVPGGTLRRRTGRTADFLFRQEGLSRWLAYRALVAGTVGRLPQVCRRFAEHVAELAAVTIDTGVYDRVRAFRAPNSRHPKTGLHKRRLSFDELLGLTLDTILELAKKPAAVRLADADAA